MENEVTRKSKSHHYYEVIIPNGDRRGGLFFPIKNGGEFRQRGLVIIQREGKEEAHNEVWDGFLIPRVGEVGSYVKAESFLGIEAPEKREFIDEEFIISYRKNSTQDENTCP